MVAKGPHPDPERLTPLRPVVFAILLILNEEERHGYGIMQEVPRRASGRSVLGPGTLYRTLKELQELGLIEPSAHRPAAESDDERRRYYRITPFGKQVAAAEAARMAALVRDAEAGDLLSDPKVVR